MAPKIIDGFISSLVELDEQVHEAVDCFDEQWFAAVQRLDREQQAGALDERDRVEAKHAAWRKAYNTEIRFVLEHGSRNSQLSPETQAAFDALLSQLKTAGGR